MNRILKCEVKSDIRNILAEIEYEEYMFNKIFKTNVTFKKSYEKFNLIYNIYGPQAYRRYVPTSYKTQDLVHLINTQDYLILYDRHGRKTYKNLMYTVNLANYSNYYSKFRTFMYRLVHIFSRKKIKIKTEEPLMLPESLPTISSK